MFLPWFIGLSVCLSVSKISHVQKNTKFKEIFERDDLRTKNIPLDFCDDESFTTWSLDTVGCVSVTYVVKAKILRPSLKSQGQGCRSEAKANAFKHMVRAEIKICSTSDSLTG